MRTSVGVAALALSVATSALGIGSAHAADDLVVTVDFVAKTARPSQVLDGISRTAFDRLFVDLPGLKGLQTRFSGNATAAWIVFDGSADPDATLWIVRARLDAADPALLADAGPPRVRWQRGTILAGNSPVQPIVEMVATVDVPRTTPEAVERGVTKPIETHLAALPGVARVRSNSWENRSQTFIELNPAFEATGNERAVREAVQEARNEFPMGASSPAFIRTTRSLDR